MLTLRLWVPMLRLSPWQQAGWGTCGAKSPSWGSLDIPHPQELLCSKVGFEQWIMWIMFGLSYAHPLFHGDCGRWKSAWPQVRWCRYPWDRSGEDKVLRPPHPWAWCWGHEGFGRTQQGDLCLQCNSELGLSERPPQTATEHYRKHIWEAFSHLTPSPSTLTTLPSILLFKNWINVILSLPPSHRQKILGSKGPRRGAHGNHGCVHVCHGAWIRALHPAHPSAETGALCHSLSEMWCWPPPRGGLSCCCKWKWPLLKILCSWQIPDSCYLFFIIFWVFTDGWIISSHFRRRR